MQKSITSLLIPPMAVCRYGCAGCCAAPIAVVWVAGITLLAYHFFGGPHANNLISVGSLLMGIGAIATSIVWAKMTLSQVDRDGCTDSKGTRGPLCQIIPHVYDNDPLADVEKFKQL